MRKKTIRSNKITELKKSKSLQKIKKCNWGRAGKNRRGNVLIKVTSGRVRVTIDAVEKQ